MSVVDTFITVKNILNIKQLIEVNFPNDFKLYVYKNTLKMLFIALL